MQSVASGGRKRMISLVLTSGRASQWQWYYRPGSHSHLALNFDGITSTWSINLWKCTRMCTSFTTLESNCVSLRLSGCARVAKSAEIGCNGTLLCLQMLQSGIFGTEMCQCSIAVRINCYTPQFFRIAMYFSVRSACMLHARCSHRLPHVCLRHTLQNFCVRSVRNAQHLLTGCAWS